MGGEDAGSGGSDNVSGSTGAIAGNVEVFDLSLHFFVDFDAIAAKFDFGSVEKSRSGIKTGKDPIQPLKTFQNVSNSAMGKSKRNVSRSYFFKSGSKVAAPNSFPSTSTAGAKIGQALKNGFSSADNSGGFGDLNGVIGCIFYRFG